MKLNVFFRPYQCADCGKSYKDSASFKRHRLGHTGERPYSCSLCAEAFIDSKALKRHREIVHPSAGPDPDLDSVGDAEEEIDDVEEEEHEEEEIDDDEQAMEEAETSKLAGAHNSSAYSSLHNGDEDEDEDELEIDVGKDAGNDGEEAQDDSAIDVAEEAASGDSDDVEKSR